jgi:hypothetical protein
MASPRRESSSKRSQTANSPLNKTQRRSNKELKVQTPRSGLIPSTRATNLHRHNKLYRCPPTPPPEIQFDLEQSFILDCKAVSNISNDYSTVNPKLGSVIPPYNSQIDSYCQSYLLLRNKFGSGKKLKPKKWNSIFIIGHSIDEVRGHELFLSNPKPIINYNGLFGKFSKKTKMRIQFPKGYRRNTPSLRKQPAIGTQTLDNNKGTVPLGRFSVVGCGKSYDYHCQCKFDQPCRCHNQDELCPCVKA